MLNVQRLRVLREVVQRGSFSAAADALDYTQPAISQAIATLEAETGATLIERDRRGLRPTAAGALLIEHAEGILARLQAAEDELHALLGVRGGHLRIASFPTAGATLMPLAIAMFRTAYPDVDLSLAEDEPSEIGPRLRAGEFDLALLFEFRDTGASLGPGLNITELFEDPMRVVLPARHRLAKRDVVRLEDLAAESWVQTSRDSACARHVVHMCRTAGFEPTVSFESDDYLVVQGLVAAGVGVALIPALALSSVREDIAVRTLAPPGASRRVVAATVRGPGVAPAVAPMLAVLREVAQRFAPPPAPAAAPGRRRAAATKA